MSKYWNDWTSGYKIIKENVSKSDQIMTLAVRWKEMWILNHRQIQSMTDMGQRHRWDIWSHRSRKTPYIFRNGQLTLFFFCYNQCKIVLLQFYKEKATICAKLTVNDVVLKAVRISKMVPHCNPSNIRCDVEKKTMFMFIVCL